LGKVVAQVAKTSKNDKNPKIIFKIEDRFTQYFEVFLEVENFIYLPIYTVPDSNSIEGF
jgi:hypothetical protein